MPFERQTQKLLGEGINLLAPSDLIAEGEAEKCVNWRPDQLGKLVARDGLRLQVGGLGDWVHTIAHVESPPSAGWYVGVDTQLWSHSAAGLAALVRDILTGAIALFDGDFLGCASFQGSLWVTNKTKRGRVVGESMYPWLPDPPTKPAVAPASGYLSGTVRYYVTYLTARGYESNPSPASDDLVCELGETNGGAWITIPACSDPQVIGFRVYREGGLLPAPYQILGWAADGNPIEDWEANPWDRNAIVFSDSGVVYDELGVEQSPDAGYVIENGVVLEDDHDPPPAAFGLAGPYFERLLAFNSTAHPNRVWYTPSMMPWYFRGSASDDGDWFDVGEEAEPIYAISVKPHMAYVYKAHSIWRLVGDPDDGLVELVTPHVGLRGPRAWASHGVIDYFKGNEGLHIMTGERALKFSEKVDPIFKGKTSGVAEPTNPMTTGAAAEYAAVMAIKNDRLYFSYPEAA